MSRPTPYPEKVKYKFKGFKLDIPAHTFALSNAYKTTRDVAKELKEEVPVFVTKARERVDHLVGIIQQLRKEIREARDSLVVTNRDSLHPSLMVIDEALMWRKGDEDKEAP